MTPEERFIKIENALSAMAERQAAHDEQMRKNNEQIRKNDEQIEKNTAAIRDLIMVSRTLIEAQTRTDAQIQEMREAQKHTDEKLNAFPEFEHRCASAPRST